MLNSLKGIAFERKEGKDNLRIQQQIALNKVQVPNTACNQHYLSPDHWVKIKSKGHWLLNLDKIQ